MFKIFKKKTPEPKLEPEPKCDSLEYNVKTIKEHYKESLDKMRIEFEERVSRGEYEYGDEVTIDCSLCKFSPFAPQDDIKRDDADNLNELFERHMKMKYRHTFRVNGVYSLNGHAYANVRMCGKISMDWGNCYTPRANEYYSILLIPTGVLNASWHDNKETYERKLKIKLGI